MEMFGTRGWKDFIEDIANIVSKTNDIEPLTTTEQLHYKKGELSILKWIMAIEQMSRDTYDQLQQED